jgi:hypothetical protein
MAFVYFHADNNRFVVGFYRPDNEFIRESTYDHADDAARRVHYLNGGN